MLASFWVKFSFVYGKFAATFPHIYYRHLTTLGFCYCKKQIDVSFYASVLLLKIHFVITNWRQFVNFKQEEFEKAGFVFTFDTFRVNGKHFEKGTFGKGWHHDVWQIVTQKVAHKHFCRLRFQFFFRRTVAGKDLSWSCKFLRRCADEGLSRINSQIVPLFSFFLKVRVYLCSGHVFQVWLL